MADKIIDVLTEKGFSLTLDRNSSWYDPSRSSPSKKRISVAAQDSDAPKLEVRFGAARSVKYLRGLNTVEVTIPKLTLALTKGDAQKWRAEWIGSAPPESVFPRDDFQAQLYGFLKQRIFMFMVP